MTARAVRFPPGRASVRLGPEHRQVYRSLYARYRTLLDGLPVLRDRDFDGRTVQMTKAEFAALDRAFAVDAEPEPREDGAFASQERAKSRLFKKVQYLS